MLPINPPVPLISSIAHVGLLGNVLVIGRMFTCCQELLSISHGSRSLIASEGLTSCSSCVLLTEQLMQLSVSRSSTIQHRQLSSSVRRIPTSAQCTRWYGGWNGRHGDWSSPSARLPARTARASACWRRRGRWTSFWIPNGANCLLGAHIDPRSTTAATQDVRFHRVRERIAVNARPFRRRFSRVCIGNISH